MESARFFFWEAIKGLSLAFLGLLAAKAVASLAAPRAAGRKERQGFLGPALYAVMLGLVALGAVSLGKDIAAELYFVASQDNLARFEIPKAYENASRAVEFRPGVLRYWQVLEAAKLAARQYRSLLGDEAALRALNGGELEPDDAYRLAVSHYYLGEYDSVIPMTGRLIRANRFFAAPYVLQGRAYAAQRKFPEAERSFLAVLQIFPSLQMAVEGLAQVHFLRGNSAAALRVLDETAKFPFPPEARKRFEDLKALYAQ